MPASMALDSAELAQIAAEAQDIAKTAGQLPGPHHLLLATFTVPGPADVLLRERGCDEDRVLAELAAAGKSPEEPADFFGDALERARQLGLDCGNARAGGLHLLIALTRLSRSSAAHLLEKTAAPVASLRTTALGYLTGAIPRRREAAMPAPRAADIGRPVTAQRSAAPVRVATLPPAEEPERRPEPGPVPEPDGAPARSLLDAREFPWLAAHARNLTALAEEGKLDPALGRERETEELLDILGKRRANNPVLVGEAGVGKTAIVEGLALRILGSERLLLQLDVSGLVAGTQLRGSFSERLIGIKDEVRRAEGRFIVFIDELHMLIGAGAAGEGPQDAANELKAALARGEFPCVGATTHDEFRKHIQGDPALERRFVPVLVREPSPADAARILRGAAPQYEAHHQVCFLPDALEAAAQLTARYVRDRYLPDKAFAAMDLAGSRARREGRSEVSREDVARAVARMAGLPEDRLLQPDGERFLSLERRLAARIVGHERNISAIARAVRRNYPGLSAQRAPEKTEPQALRALEQARGGFPPELWGRLDEKLVFAPLARGEVGRIAQLLLEGSSRRLWDERRIAFRIGPGLVEHLISAGGYQIALGARPMRQVIQRLVESPLADEILAGRVKSGETLLAYAGGSGVEFRRE